MSGAGASAVVDVIIMLGTNDSKNFNWAPSGKPKNDQQFLSDYRAMVEHFSALAPKPLVFLALPLATGNSPCCSIDGTVIHDEIVPLIKQLAAEKHLPTIDLNTPTTGHPNTSVTACTQRRGVRVGREAGARWPARDSAQAGGTGGAGAGAGGAVAGGVAARERERGQRWRRRDSGPAWRERGSQRGSSSNMAGAGTALAGPGAGASAGGVAALAQWQQIEPAADPAGAVRCREPGAGSLSAFGLLGLGWLFARRRAR